MRVIIANYRYFIAGGPEKYMFKFMESAKKMGIDVIPFSVNNPQNEYTPYSKYFAKPRSNQLMYGQKLVQGMQVHKKLMLKKMSESIAAHHLLCLFVQLAIDKNQWLIKIERK